MSKNIDTNIVEMRFDNEQFEKKCAQSMSTLEKLKAKINDTNSGDALKGLSSANAIDISHIEKSVDAVANRFTFLGNLAFKIKDQIADAFISMAKTIATKVPSIIKQGGWERAMNIEKAKFQLEGLHVEWEKIYDDIDYAVAGTAYGLDAAAKAASQLVASGVQVGSSMKEALRGISGVASMTQSQYEEIAPIFTTVAGQGKLMTMQLRQLESRGLNVAAILAKSMGTSEAAIREMVTQGKIDFETFAHYMDEEFGEHAKDANRTFEGVTANIRASLKKLGAAFVTPVIKQDGPVVKALEQLRERMEEFRKSLTPLTDAWEGFIDVTATAAGKVLENLDMSFVPSLVNALVNSFHALLTVVTPVAYAIKDVFAPKGTEGVKTFSEVFEKFSEKLILSKSEMEDLRATVRGVLSIFDIFTTIIKQFLGALMGVDANTISIRATLLKITGALGKIITYISIVIKDMNIVGPTVKGISMALEVLVTVLGFTISKIIEFVTWVSKLEITRKIFDAIGKAAYILAGSIALLVTKVTALIKALKTGNVDKLGTFGKTLIAIKNTIVDFGTAIANLGFVQGIISGVAGAFQMLKDAIDGLFNKDEKITKTTTVVMNTVRGAEAPMTATAHSLSLVGEASEEASTGMGSLADNIIRFIKNIPIARILAIGMAATLFISLYNITQAVYDFGKGVKNIGGFLTTLGNKGLLAMIFGWNQTQWKPNKIIDIAIAIGAVTAAIWSFSRIPADDMERSIKIMSKMALMFVGVVAAMATLDKWLGFAGALQPTALGMAEIAASMVVLAGAFRMLSDINIKNIEQTQHILGGMLVSLTAIVAITGKLGLAFSKSGLAFVGMATSILILVQAFKQLNEMSLPTRDFFKDMGAKLGAMAVLAIEMMALAKICDLVGGKSFMRLASSMLMFTLSLQIVNALLDKLPADFTTKLLNRMKQFSTDLKEFFTRAVEIGATVVKLAIVMGSIVLALGIISGGIKRILEKIKGITEAASKIRKYQDYHKKALNTLATAALVASIGATAVIISGLLVVLVKADLAKNKEAFIAGLSSLVIIFAALTTSMVLIQKFSKEAKGAGAAALGVVLAFGVLVASTIGVASYIYSIITKEGDWKSKAAEIALAGGSLILVLGVFRSIGKSIGKLSNIQMDNAGAKAIIAMVASIGVIAASVIMLSREMTDFGRVSAIVGSFVLLGAAMEGFVFLIRQIAKINQYAFKPSTARVIQSMVLAVVGIAGSLTVLSKYGGTTDQMITAMFAISGVFATFVALVKVINDMKVKNDTFKTMKLIIGEIIAVAGSLIALTYLSKDIPSILAATASLSIVFTAFAGMTRVIGEGSYTKNDFKAMLYMIGEIVAVGSALTLLTHVIDDPAQVLAAAESMSLVIAAFGTMTLVMSKGRYNKSLWTGMLGVVTMAVAIGGALSLLVYAMKDSDSAIKAALAMSIVVGVFGGMTVLLSKMSNTMEGMVVLLGVSGAALMVAEGLSKLSGFNWSEMLAAVTGMSLVALAFAGIAILAGTLPQSLIGMVAMIGIGAAAIEIGSSLASVAQYDWQNILAAAGAMVTTMGLFSAAAAILGTIAPIAAVGAGVLLLIGAATIPFAYGLKITSEAMINFSKALKISLPQVQKFFTTMSQNGKSMASVIIGLAALSQSLLIMSPALAAGSRALLAYANALSKANNATKKAVMTDFEKLPKKMYEIGKWLPTSLAKGMRDTQSFNYMIRTGQYVAHSLEEAVRNVLGVHSLSQIWKSIGEWLPESLKAGMEETFPSLIEEGESGATTLMDTVSDVLQDQGFADGMMDWWGDLGTDVGNVFGKKLDEAVINAMKDRLAKVQQFINENFTSKYGNVNEHNKSGYYGGVSGPSILTQGKKIAKEEGFDDFTEWLTQVDESLTGIAGDGLGGGSAGKATEAVNRLEEALKGLTKGEKVSLKSFVNNLNTTYRETTSWATDMNILMTKGFDKNITDWIKKMGVGGHETVKAFMSASKEEVAYLNAMVPKILSLDKDAEKAITQSYAKGGLAAMQAFSAALKSYDSKLAQTVQAALDPFGEFNKKNELTSGKLLSNMQSQLDGIREWSNNLGILMQKGVDEGIIEKFKELGPASYEEVNAMVHMTADQIAKANEIWAQQMNIGEEVALSIAQKAEEVGGYVTDGFVKGIRIEDAQAQGLAAGNATIEGLKTGVDAHSPSKKSEQVGIWTMLGMVGGMRKKYDALLTETRRIGNGTINTMKIYFNESTGSKLGMDLTRGMTNGIAAGSSSVISAIGSLCRSVIDRANAMFDRHSPSRVFRSMFYDLDRGAVLGVEDGKNLVLNSIDNMAGSVIDHMSLVVANIADRVSGEFEDISPVITPKLDFSNLQNGKSIIDDMFGGTSLQMAGAIMSNHSVDSQNVNEHDTEAPNTGKSTTVIFNQTNNSPKAIDPYESYRLGRLAAEQMKGALR